MSRVQLALNVSDLDEAIAFYSKLFATEPSKVRPGYANFAIDEPPLKLVLIEGNGEPGSLNHLGVEVETTDEVTAAQARLVGDDLATTTEDGVTCCFAVQDKVWVDGPSGEPWEIYTVLEHVEMPGGRLRTVDRDRHDALAALLRVRELGRAVLGGERACADDEDDALGRVDRVVDVLRPVRRRRDVLPVDPDVPLLSRQPSVQLPHEIGVLSRVRDEDVGHPRPSSHIRPARRLCRNP